MARLGLSDGMAGSGLVARRQASPAAPVLIPDLQIRSVSSPVLSQFSPVTSVALT